MAYNSQRPDLKEYWKKSKLSKEIKDKLNDRNWLETEYVKKRRTLVDIAQEVGVYYGTVCEYCLKHGFKIRRRSNYSMTENEIAEYIRNLGIEVNCNNWSVLGNKEIDILIESHKLGIEVNGLYWHSTTSITDSDKHLQKTCDASEAGYQLIHITDYNWKNQQEIVKNIIRSKLGLNKRIYARKCQIKELTNSEVRDFFNNYHLQGHINGSYILGLYHANELVLAMIFGNSRFNDEIELLRFCSKPGITIVGGGSKLLKRASKYFNSDIISYCDRDWSNGNGYLKMGFKLERTTGPGFFWTDGTNIISRYRAQKQNLKKWLASYEPTKSQRQNMIDAGFRIYYTTGNFVFRYARSDSGNN